MKNSIKPWLDKFRSSPGAVFVAAGIFLSRIFGLVRDRVFAHYFGNSDIADAIRAAQRIPNFLQNLFGEGVLSASFIPVYSKLLAEKRDDEADRLASVVFAVLSFLIAVLVLAGMAATPWLIDVIAPGFEGEKRDLTIQLVRIVFPGTGILVGSAWCLGILNSHRRFFLSYFAPVVWNLTIIIALIAWGSSTEQRDLGMVCAWAMTVGCVFQFLMQLPTALKLMGSFRPRFDFSNSGFQKVLQNFFPVLMGRGVVQISGYIDNMIASLLSTGAVSALSYAQTLYMLPVSLFGMSVSAASLPEMSSHTGDRGAIREKILKDLQKGIERIAYFVLPTALVFIFMGDTVVALIYQTGKFSRADSAWVGWVLAGSSIGLLAATWSRLLSSAFYALGDARTPFKISVARVVLGVVLGVTLSFWGPQALGVDARYGVVFLSLSVGITSWLELASLWHFLKRELAQLYFFSTPIRNSFRASVISLLVGYLARWPLSRLTDFFTSLLVLAVTGGVYLLIMRRSAAHLN